jgi:hypothetical protein
MNNSEILASKIGNLPEELKKEVLDFMEYLMQKHKMQSKSRKTPKFGSCKGLFLIPSDFDEPLEDFQEYMW